MKADKKFIVIVYAPREGKYVWKTFDSKPEYMAWVDKRIKSKNYAQTYKMFPSLVSMRRFVRNADVNITWSERALEKAIIDILKYFTGIEYPSIDWTKG